MLIVKSRDLRQRHRNAVARSDETGACAPRFAPDTRRLLKLLCDKLAALGIPIARATAHVRTLHPEYRGAARIWRRGESIELRTTRHGIQFTADYQNSPFSTSSKPGGGSTPC